MAQYNRQNILKIEQTAKEGAGTGTDGQQPPQRGIGQQQCTDSCNGQRNQNCPKGNQAMFPLHRGKRIKNAKDRCQNIYGAASRSKNANHQNRAKRDLLPMQAILTEQKQTNQQEKCKHIGILKKTSKSTINEQPASAGWEQQKQSGK